jgi:hypothetical protein
MSIQDVGIGSKFLLAHVQYQHTYLLAPETGKILSVFTNNAGASKPKQHELGLGDQRSAVPVTNPVTGFIILHSPFGIPNASLVRPFKIQGSRFKVQVSPLDVGCWMLDVRCCVFRSRSPAPTPQFMPPPRCPIQVYPLPATRRRSGQVLLGELPWVAVSGHSQPRHLFIPDDPLGLRIKPQRPAQPERDHAQHQGHIHLDVLGGIAARLLARLDTVEPLALMAGRRGIDFGGASLPFIKSRSGRTLKFPA